MRFLEYETWRLKKDCPESDRERAIQGWFHSVKTWKQEHFPELVKASFYGQCNRDGAENGVYVMIFEYESKEGYVELHQRGAVEAAGPCTQYGGIDLSLFFENVSTSFICMEPQKEELWFDYTAEKLAKEKAAGVSVKRFLEYEIWKVHPDVDFNAYENMIETWFKYCVQKKNELFEPWVSARYYRQCNQKGKPNGVYVMLFEYDCIEGHHAYKAGKLHSYAVNDGRYAQYASNDPYQFFDLTSVNIDCMQPQREELWLNCDAEKKSAGK